MFRKDPHRWVMPLGWIWNKAGSPLKALCKILVGIPGICIQVTKFSS